MEAGLTATLNDIQGSFSAFIPEMLFGAAMVIMLLFGMVFRKQERSTFFHGLALLFFLASTVILLSQQQIPVKLFGNMIQRDHFATYLKMLAEGLSAQ